MTTPFVIRPSSILVHAIAGMLAALVAAPAGAFARQSAADDKVAGVGETLDAAELVPAAAAGLPPILPGQEPGAHGKPAAAAATPSDTPREWFGSSPWTDWGRASGDWGGARTALGAAGIDFNGSLISDWSDVFAGGSGRASAFRYLLDLNVTFDLGLIAGIEHASVFADYQNADTTVGGLLHGGYQSYSNIAMNSAVSQLSQLWYQQWFADESVRLKVGKVDANAEFGYLASAAGFINGSAAYPPTIFVLPTCPNQAMSVNLFVYPCEGLYIGAAVYDGASAVDGVTTGSVGPGTFFSDDKSDDWFLIGEAGYTFASTGPLDSTRVAVGGWWHTGDFTTFSGGTEDGTGGFYAIAESRAWRPDGVEIAAAGDPRGLWMFLQYGCADGAVSSMRQQFGAGSSLKGTFSGRDDDSLGLYLTVLDFSNDPAAGLGSNECALECFYDIAVTPSVHIKPDLQWYLSPADGSDDSLVGTLRVTIAF